MKRRSFIQGSAAAAVLGAPHLAGLAQQSRHAQVPHLHGAAVERVADDAQAVDGQGREGFGRAHQVRGLPGDAARRHAGAAVRPGARRRRRHRLDAAGQHRRALPARRGVRAAVHDEQRRGHVEGLLGVRSRPRRPTSSRTRMCWRCTCTAPACSTSANKQIKTRGRPEGHEGARPDAPDHQDARLRSAPRRWACRCRGIPDALSKGTIDGCVIPWEVVPSVKVARADASTTASSTTRRPALYTTTFVMTMNKAKYESLPPDLKKVIDDNSGLATSGWLGKIAAGQRSAGAQGGRSQGRHHPCLQRRLNGRSSCGCRRRSTRSGSPT